MDSIGKHLAHTEQNIRLVTEDPIALYGFTQVPNFLFFQMKTKDGKTIKLKPQTRFVYAKFLSYAWDNDCVFPGQDTLAEDLDMGRSTVTECVGELKKAGLLTIKRRGQGRTNIYELHFVVNKTVKKTARRKG